MVRENPVAVLLRVSSALVTSAPLGSVIVPRKEVVAVCPKAEKESAASVRKIMTAIPIDFMWVPPIAE